MILRIIIFMMMIVSSVTRPLFNMIDRRNQLTCSVCMTALKTESIMPSDNPTDFSFKSIKICNAVIDSIQRVACGETLLKNAKQFVKDQMNKVLPMTSCINAGVTDCGVTLPPTATPTPPMPTTAPTSQPIPTTLPTAPPPPLENENKIDN
jgi:hypothetical protein